MKSLLALTLSLLSTSAVAETCDSLVAKTVLDTSPINAQAEIEDTRVLENLNGYCEDDQECLPDTQIYYLRTADKNRMMKRFVVVTESLDNECSIVSVQEIKTSKN